MPVAPQSDAFVIAYNGVRFSERAEIVDINYINVWSATGRNAAAVTITLTVRDWIGEENQALTPMASTDAQMEEVAARLMQPGRALVLIGAGCGDMAVNVTADADESHATPAQAAWGTKDVLWGPRPQRAVWKPYGGPALSGELTFTVSVSLACLPDGPENYDGVFDWAWSLSVALDQSGYATRKIAGHVRCAGRIDPDNPGRLVDNADRLLKRITPNLLPGFRRVGPDTTLSEAKDRLNFSFVDRQVGPNYPPEGVIDVQASHTYSTSEAMSIIFSGTVEASYEMQLGVSRAKAVEHFNDLYKARIDEARRTRTTINSKAQNAWALTTAVSVSEPEVYGRRCAKFVYHYQLTCALHDLLASGAGLWKPVPGNSWRRWSASLTDGAFHERGVSKLAFRNSEDAIIDLCDPAPPPKPGLTVFTPESLIPGRTPPKLPQDGGWLVWRATLRLFWVWDLAIHLPLPRRRPDPPDVPRWQGGGSVRQFDRPAGGGSVRQFDAPSGGGRGGSLRAFDAPAGGGQSGSLAQFPPAEAAAPIIQRRGEPVYVADFTVQAMRAGSPVTTPNLESVAGTPAILAGGDVRQSERANWFGVPVYCFAGVQRYVLTGRPKGAAEVPENVMGE